VNHLQGQKWKKLFRVSAIAPLISVILSTLFVFLTRADKHGVKIVSSSKPQISLFFVFSVANVHA
jgi:hypothetical protein